MDEQLKGGRSNPAVFRRGDRVHRAPHINSEFVRLLLHYLDREGFDAAPQAHGSDENHMDVFSFIEGHVPGELEFYDDATLADAAKLIRRFHDATTSLLSDAAQRAGMEVVCHNDLSPCNFVFRDHRPIAIIDFDAAAVGRRVYDLGYAAWLWLQLGDDDIPAQRQIERLQGFLASYGKVNSLREVVEGTRLRQTVVMREADRVGNQAMKEWAGSALQWTTQCLLPLISE
jgi:Ser/Thr protein kinase RdoA (MazF antagonist)